MSWINLLDVIYPIGSIYLSRDSSSPANLIGGTWTAIQDAMLGGIGEEVIEGYNGSKKISVAQMPSHTHPAGSSDSNPYFYSFSTAHNTDTGTDIKPSEGRKFPYTTGTIADTTAVRAAGGGEDYCPYNFGIYIWYRVS